MAEEDPEDDRFVGGADDSRDGAADAFSPPERNRSFRRNPAMLTVLIVVVAALTVFVVVLAIR